MNKKVKLPKNETVENTTENPLVNLTDNELDSLVDTIVKLSNKQKKSKCD